MSLTLRRKHFLLFLFETVYGLRRKSLSRSGAVLASVVGFVLTLSSYCFVSDLLMFFLSSSKLTKFRSERKKCLEDEFKEGMVYKLLIFGLGLM